MNDLLTSQHSFKGNGYADNSNINCGGKSRGKYLNTLTERTQSALRIVERWCLDVGLGMKPNKSDQIIFTKKRLQGYRNPALSEHEIQRKYVVKIPWYYL